MRAAALEVLLGVGSVVPHTDADGLAAGAISLRARRESATAAVLLGRGETPFGREPPLPPGSVAVLDWGVRELAPPGLLVDHHAPEAEPGPDQIVVSGYGAEPELSTAPLMRRLVPEAPAWLAAVGAVGDLGDAGLRLPECEGTPKIATRKLASLVSAPRRLLDGPVREALALLVESDGPKAALADPRAQLLEDAKREWRAGLEAAMKTAPRVGSAVALVRFSSPYQVHPLVAQAWQRRLAPRVVLAANDGYLPGRVNFAMRGGESDLRELLRGALPDLGGEFAHGHDRATGGSIDPRDFDRLLATFGLAP